MKALAGTLAFAFGTWSALSICWALTGSLAVGITCAILGAFCFGRFCDWCEVTADDCWDVALGCVCAPWGLVVVPLLAGAAVGLYVRARLAARAAR